MLHGVVIGKKITIIDEEEFLIALAIISENETKEYSIMAWTMKNFLLLETTMGWQESIEKFVPARVLI